MIVPVMAISNLVLTQQIYSEETNGAHAHYREPVPLKGELGESIQGPRGPPGLPGPAGEPGRPAIGASVSFKKTISVLNY